MKNGIILKPRRPAVDEGLDYFLGTPDLRWTAEDPANPNINNPEVGRYHQISPDVCWLGVPSRSSWLKVQVTPEGTGIYWHRAMSDRNQRVMLVGFSTGGNNYPYVFSEDGGKTWGSHSTFNMLLPGAYHSCRNGGFAVHSAYLDIAVWPPGASTPNIATPADPSGLLKDAYAGRNDLYGYCTVESLDDGRYIASAYMDDSKYDTGLAVLAESTDAGASWSSWQLIGSPVLLSPYQGHDFFGADIKEPMYTISRIAKIGDRYLMIGDSAVGVLCTDPMDASTYQIINFIFSPGAYHGNDYDKLDPATGYPIDDAAMKGGMTLSKFAYDTGGGYYGYFQHIADSRRGYVVACDINGPGVVTFTPEGYRFGGQDNLFGWVGNDVTPAWSDQWGMLVPSTQSYYCIYTTRAHFKHNPMNLQFMSSIAPLSTTDTAFYDSLLAVHNPPVSPP